MARAIVVLSFEIQTGDEMGPILRALDPQRIPYFAGQARVAVEPVASQVESWLDHEPAPSDSEVTNGHSR